MRAYLMAVEGTTCSSSAQQMTTLKDSFCGSSGALGGASEASGGDGNEDNWCILVFHVCGFYVVIDYI